MIRFIHAADLHLDSPFKGLKQLHPDLFEFIYQATFQSLANIVTLAIEEKVDFLLISGDIYDGDNQSVKAQAFFRDQMRRLDQVAIPVFLLHGNHDYMDQDISRLQLPKNVTLFGDQPETHSLHLEDSVAITGFSYPKRWVKERMIEKYPLRQPVDFHIGMLHGFLEGSHSKEDVYAPFALEDLLKRNYDYWALGHIHKREVLQTYPPIVYSGNTQGRNPNETGEKGVYMVTLQKGMDARLQFVNTAPIFWQEKIVSLKNTRTLDGLYSKLTQVMEQVKHDQDQMVLLSVVLEDRDDLPDDLIERIQNGDLLAGVKQDQTVYLYRIALAAHKRRFIFSADSQMQESFMNSKNELENDDNYRRLLQDLFKHPIVRTRFSDLEADQELKEQIIQAAEELLLEDIVFEEGEIASED